MTSHNWTFARLGDLIETNSETYSEKEKWDYINYLDTGNITDNRIDEIIKLDVRVDKIPSRAKRKIKGGDVVISTVRPNQRHFGIIKSPPPNFLVSTGFTTIRANFEKASSDFIFWYLSQSTIVEYLQGVGETSTSAYPAIKPSDIEALELFVPPLAEQKAIASVLGALDGKIENNRQMNETLEEMARAIFKSWFVDFDPVRAKMEGRPTELPDDISDLFPNELVDSEIGQIPKGWSIAELSDLADITMGQSPPGDTYNDNQVGLPFYQGSTDFGFRFPSIRKFCSDSRRLAETDDVLLSVRAPVGDLNRAKMQCCIGRGLATIRSKTKHSSWIFYRCSFLKEYFDTFNSEGTVFGSVNGRDLKAIKSVNPPERIFDSYERIVSPMDKSIRVKTDEIDTLAELRDTLLPKLISGEIRVADAERKKETL